MGAIGIVPETVPLDVTIGIEPEPTPGWVPTPAVGLDMVIICGEGGLESDELREDPVWGLRGL